MHLEDFSPDYGRCPECQTLVLRETRGEAISQVRDDEQDFYGKNYYLRHLQEEHGYPNLETRARADLPERCLHWLQTLLKYVSGPGARTLELGCGHGGFVAMQRWAGLDATGLELSPWLVRQARGLFNVPVLEGRLEEQELAAGLWDAVVMMDVLEHLPDPRQTLGRAVSLLRGPGGFLLIQTPCYPEGWSYEALLAQDHPFLRQLKPVEHLYLFSKQAVARLCAELGVGQVRFEPPIFAHYDLFALASAGPLPERTVAERAEMLLAAIPPARETLALLDLGEVRDGLSTRLAQAAAEFESLQAATAELWPKLDAAENARNLARAQFEDVKADHAARLAVIEGQGTEISRLHEDVDRLLQEANAFWPQLDVAINERNLLASQIEDLGAHFQRSEADRAARLEIIESRGAELGELRSQLALTGSELAELRVHYERSEADRAARLKVIESQGRELGELRAQLALIGSELTDLRAHFRQSEADRAARLEIIEGQGAELGELRAQLSLNGSELADLRAHHERSEADRAARLKVIESQGDELGKLRTQLAVTGDELVAMHGHFERSEADRAARLAVIESQGAEVGRLQTQLHAAGVEQARLAADASAMQSAHAALTTEHARLAAEAAEIRTSHAALTGEYETLRHRKKTLDKHWTTWLLKRLRLWPLGT